MKLTCDAKELSESVSIAATIVPSRSPKPVLMNLALVAHNGLLEVLATDLEVGMRVTVRKVEVEREGAVLVNASRLAQILKELDDERVEISESDSAGCVIKASGARFRLYGEDFSEYPTIARFGAESGALAFPADGFQEMVAKTSFAAATDVSRYAMNGVRLEINKSDLTFVATDGRRLALVKRKIDQGSSEPMAVVVPTKGLNTVTRLLTTGEETIFLRFEQSNVLIKTACAEITARLVEGHYPPYEAVIPKNLDKEVSLDRDSFLSKVRMASLLTTRDSQTVRFQFADKGLTLSARTVDVGESSVQLDLDYKHEPVAIGFNPVFIQDALKVVTQKNLRFRFSDPKGAAILEEDEGGLVYVVMPINLGDGD